MKVSDIFVNVLDEDITSTQREIMRTFNSISKHFLNTVHFSFKTMYTAMKLKNIDDREIFYRSIQEALQKYPYVNIAKR